MTRASTAQGRPCQCDMYLEEVKSRPSRNIHSTTSKFLRRFLQKKPFDRSRKEDACSHMVEGGSDPISLPISKPQHLVSTQLFRRERHC
jgi:hypothetical protein